jgi:hypothetical protein
VFLGGQNLGQAQAWADQSVGRAQLGLQSGPFVLKDASPIWRPVMLKIPLNAAKFALLLEEAIAERTSAFLPAHAAARRADLLFPRNLASAA